MSITIVINIFPFLMLCIAHDTDLNIKEYQQRGMGAITMDNF